MNRCAHWIFIIASAASSGCDLRSAPPGTSGDGIPAIRGEVRYQGSQRAPLKVAVFTSFPPRGAPVAHQQFTAPEFPQPFSVTGLQPGRYFVLALLDVDERDGDRFRPARDPGGAYGGFGSPVAVTVEAAGGLGGVAIELHDPGAGSPWSGLDYR